MIYIFIHICIIKNKFGISKTHTHTYTHTHTHTYMLYIILPKIMYKYVHLSSQTYIFQKFFNVLYIFMYLYIYETFCDEFARFIKINEAGFFKCLQKYIAIVNVNFYKLRICHI